MLDAQEVIHWLATSFPRHAPEAVEEFIEIAMDGCEPENVEVPSPQRLTRAKEVLAAVQAGLREREQPVSVSLHPTDPVYEVIHLSQHLYLLSPETRLSLYPLCIETYVRYGAHGTEEFSLYRYALEYLSGGILNREQESALLAAWCYRSEHGEMCGRYAFDKAWLWSFLIDDMAGIPPRIAASLIQGYGKELAHRTVQLDLAVVASLPLPLLNDWLDQLTTWTRSLYDEGINRMLPSLTAARARRRLEYLLRRGAVQL